MTRNQGFGSVIFNQVETDLLDTDTTKNETKLEMKIQIVFSQRF